MKGIILAGGNGTRLFPSTMVISKQLLPVYDKPMVYYPLSVLLLAGIRDILVITRPSDRHMFESLLRDGRQFGVSISYAVQPRPEGIAQALLIGRDFIDGGSCVLVLGDNIFHGDGLATMLKAAAQYSTGATVFAHEVVDPQRYGVVTFDGADRAIAIEEKPTKPSSKWAITGLYFFGTEAVRYAADVSPSGRGELEITDIIRRYLDAGVLRIERMGRGYAWFDMGTIDSLVEASEFVAAIERRQGSKICCPEEIALRSKFISPEELDGWLSGFGKNAYSDYVRRVAFE
jgi:glucose-1-phosphate thymidylyltransferase